MELENLNNNHTMSSREIAQLTGKNHQHELRDCDKLNLSYEKLGMSKIGQGYFTTPHTGNQQYREMLLSKIQTMDLMTGYSVELRIKVNRRWEELENKSNQLINPSAISRLQLAQMIIEAEEVKQKLQIELKEVQPLVTFAKALQISEHNIRCTVC